MTTRASNCRPTGQAPFLAVERRSDADVFVGTREALLQAQIVAAEAFPKGRRRSAFTPGDSALNGTKVERLKCGQFRVTRYHVERRTRTCPAPTETAYRGYLDSVARGSVGLLRDAALGLEESLTGFRVHNAEALVGDLQRAVDAILSAEIEDIRDVHQGNGPTLRLVEPTAIQCESDGACDE